MDDVQQKKSLLARQYLGGSMFIAKVEVLRPLLLLGLQIEDFELESGQVDGTLAHALERWIGIVAETNGYSLAQLSGNDKLVPQFGFRFATMLYPKSRQLD